MRSDLCAPLSDFTIEDRGSYGVQLYAQRPASGFFGKFSLLAFPYVPHHPPQTLFLCPFILSFLSRVSTHERFTSRVKDTRLPVLYHDRSSGHDTTLHTEFLDHRPSIRRGLGILMILRYYRRKHLI